MGCGHHEVDNISGNPEQRQRIQAEIADRGCPPYTKEHEGQELPMLRSTVAQREWAGRIWEQALKAVEAWWEFQILLAATHTTTAVQSDRGSQFYHKRLTTLKAQRNTTWGIECHRLWPELMLRQSQWDADNGRLMEVRAYNHPSVLTPRRPKTTQEPPSTTGNKNPPSARLLSWNTLSA